MSSGFKQFIILDIINIFPQCIDNARANGQMEGLGILLAYQKEKYGTVGKKHMRVKCCQQEIQHKYHKPNPNAVYLYFVYHRYVETNRA